jgi:superfamily II DNA or RNA helicase
MAPPLSAFSLWDHQREAVLKLRGYVKAYQNGTTDRAALVHVPTGAGKTGVIALLTRLTTGVRNSLVLAPRLALRDQLGRDVESRFFKKLAKSPDLSKIPKAVRVWDSPPKKATIDALANTVVIATIQAFHRWSTRPGDGKRMKDRIDLLVVDEGHCEPAPQWRQVVRTVSKPTVLFTATPYRNDLKPFDIDYDYAVGLTHREALDEKILRPLTVRDRPSLASPDAFVDDVLDQYQELFGTMDQDDPNAPRVIIRCEAHDRIRQIGKALSAKGVEYVAVHEQFRDGRDHEFRHVPDPATTKALVWVHQFKMVEGIDDARFRLVALYDPIRNTRMLIQQVGRVLRNPERDDKQEAYLLDHHRSLHGREWEHYLAYDEVVRTHGVKAILEPTQQMFERILSVLPPIAYLDRTFRTPLDPKTLDPKEDLRFPKSANVFRYDKTASISEMKKRIKAHCDERDLPVTLYPVGTDTLVAVYFVHRNSPYLDGVFFLDAWLGVAIVHTIGDWIFVFDSDGAVPDDLPGMGEPIPPAKLRRVFQDPTLTRLTHVSVRNSNLARSAVRARAFSAVSIRDTLPFPDDRGCVCSTAEGYTPRASPKVAAPDNLVRRYVGLYSGRISEYDSAGCRLDGYLAWLAEIATQILSSAKALPEFVRYAQESSVPPDPTPTHILLDAAEILDQYVTIPDLPGEDEQPLMIEDLALAVTRRQKGEGEFEVTANGTPYQVAVRYDAARRKYILASPDLEGAYRPTNPLYSEGVVRLLNSLQGFRLLTESRGYFYTHGQFYHPEVEFGPSYNDDQLGILRVLSRSAKGFWQDRTQPKVLG